MGFASLPFLLLVVIVLQTACDATWMESSVQFSVQSSPDDVFRLYSNLTEHPKWSPWLERIDVDNNTGVSQWTLFYLGLRYSWYAKNTVVEPPRMIQWESISGLPNKGKIEFIGDRLACNSSSPVCEDEGTLLKLTVSYNLPFAAAVVLRALGPVADTFIQRLLVDDFRRFESVLMSRQWHHDEL